MKNLISAAQNTDTTILEDIIYCAERLQIVTNRELIIQYASKLKLAIEDSGIDAEDAIKQDLLELPSDTALEVYDVLFEGFGTESITGDNWVDYYCDITYLYVNMGDLYTNTLIYDVRRNELFYGCLGDILELS